MNFNSNQLKRTWIISDDSSIFGLLNLNQNLNHDFWKCYQTRKLPKIHWESPQNVSEFVKKINSTSYLRYFLMRAIKLFENEEIIFRGWILMIWQTRQFSEISIKRWKKSLDRNEGTNFEIKMLILVDEKLFRTWDLFNRFEFF